MPDSLPARISQATAYTHLAAIQSNAAYAQSLAPDAGLLAMVKANAYGHGVRQVSAALHDYASEFAVARLDEAQALRESGCSRPIVVMSELLDAEKLDSMQQAQLSPVIYCDEQAPALIQHCESIALPYWLKLNTGMHRLGLARSLSSLLNNAQHCEVIATHFHSADAADAESTHAQFKSFALQLEAAPAGSASTLSVANSATLLNPALQKVYHDWQQQFLRQGSYQREVIRPGIMLYGSNPVESGVQQPLQAAMTFSAPILAIHQLQAGEAVGYSQRWRAERASTIATVGVGYGDGYPRHAGNGTPVAIRGQRAALAGTVSMDMIGVDITELVDNGMDIGIGERVELWGQDISVDEVAEAADTISYQLLTGISTRVRREYRTD